MSGLQYNFRNRKAKKSRLIKFNGTTYKFLNTLELDQLSVAKYSTITKKHQKARRFQKTKKRFWTQKKSGKRRNLHLASLIAFGKHIISQFFEIIFARVCAINSCGRSQFSEYGSYKTSTPGFPGAPWNIKVSKTDLGASLAWQPPANADVIEYSVYLSVKKEYTTGQSVSFSSS